MSLQDIHQQRVKVRDLDPDGFIWGAASIGRAINRTERQVFHLAAKGIIDVDKVGKLLRTTPRRLGLVRE